MINSMQTAIMKKDLRGLVFNKRLFPVLMIVPLVLIVVIPTIFILSTHFVPDDMSDFEQILKLLPVEKQFDDMQRVIMGLMLNYIMPLFFMIIPVMAATVMATSSFVGEKEKRTLETLLYCPLSLKEIFKTKIFSSFILSMFVSVSSFLVMIIVVEIEILVITGSLLLPSINWLITMLLVSPAISLVAITLIVNGSAKSQSMEEAQQKSTFLIIPVILLVVGQFSGVILINGWLLLGLGVIFAIVAIFLMKGCMRKFNYEMLLK